MNTGVPNGRGGARGARARCWPPCTAELASQPRPAPSHARRRGAIKMRAWPSKCKGDAPGARPGLFDGGRYVGEWRIGRTRDFRAARFPTSASGHCALAPLARYKWHVRAHDLRVRTRHFGAVGGAMCGDCAHAFRLMRADDCAPARLLTAYDVGPTGGDRRLRRQYQAHGQQGQRQLGRPGRQPGQ